MRITLGLFVLAFVSVLSRPQHSLVTFTIHDDKWAVLEVQALTDPQDDGETSCSERLIRIRKDVQGKERAKTLMHEVLHALGCENGIAHDDKWNNSNDAGDGCEGHCGIYFGGEALTDLVVNNPELIALIQAEGSK